MFCFEALVDQMGSHAYLHFVKCVHGLTCMSAFRYSWVMHADVLDNCVLLLLHYTDPQ